MAALRAVLGCRGAPAPHPPPGQCRGAAGGLLQRLGQWFYEVDVATAWGERLRRHRLRSRNTYSRFLRDTYGDNVVAAVFTLSCGGGVRFEGQEHWIRPESRWRPEVLRLRDVPVVALDLSGSPLTYDGLDNLACGSCRWPAVPTSPRGVWPPSTTSGSCSAWTWQGCGCPARGWSVSCWRRCCQAARSWAWTLGTAQGRGHRHRQEVESPLPEVDRNLGCGGSHAIPPPPPEH
ncbi:distal membrane-arm assembly complex protein 2 isoform X2 [Buteo buteo]|uniref:distal membrane-arm assembly complex protein 2 isoform X2 n=1 Tax=Buteo buteo TaxID=30397 RepID=UPI003EBFA29A